MSQKFDTRNTLKSSLHSSVLKKRIRALDLARAHPFDGLYGPRVELLQNKERHPSVRSHYPLQAIDREAMRKVLLEHYLVNGSHMTLRNAYEHLLKAHYSYVDSDGFLRRPSRDMCPSYDQFWRFMDTTWPLHTRQQMRLAWTEVKKAEHRNVASRKQVHPHLQPTYEVDVVERDIYFMSANDGRLVRGKLYSFIDRSTGLNASLDVRYQSKGAHEVELLLRQSTKRSRPSRRRS